MKYYWLIGLILLAGCDYKENTSTKQLNTGTDGGRMRITESQLFKDASGYDRNILVISDTKTGEEYLAVGGCGVLTLRNHGKAGVRDE